VEVPAQTRARDPSPYTPGNTWTRYIKTIKRNFCTGRITWRFYLWVLTWSL